MVLALALDMTVTLGNVITGAVALVALFAVYTRIMERLARIETQLTPLWTEFERRRRSR